MSLFARKYPSAWHSRGKGDSIGEKLSRRRGAARQAGVSLHRSCRLEKRLMRNAVCESCAEIKARRPKPEVAGTVLLLGSLAVGNVKAK